MPSSDTQFQNDPSRINRKGRPRESVIFKKLKKLTQEEILTAYWKVFELTDKEAKQILKNDNTPLLERALIMRMQKGDIDVIMNRLVGMPKQTVEEKGDHKLTINVIKAEGNKPDGNKP